MDSGLRVSWGWGQIRDEPSVAVRQEAETLPSLAQPLTLSGGLCWDHGVDASRQAGKELLEEEQGILQGKVWSAGQTQEQCSSPVAHPHPAYSPGPR